MLGDLVVAQPIVRAIIKIGGQPFRQTVRGTVVAHAVDNLEPAPPFRDHFRQDFGRVLQVDVHRHHRRAPGMLDPRGQRGLLAEVAREGNGPDTNVVGVRLANGLERPVATAVINEQDLELSVRQIGDAAQHISHARDEWRDGLLFVLHGDDDREDAVRHHAAETNRCAVSRTPTDG